MKQKRNAEDGRFGQVAGQDNLGDERMGDRQPKLSVYNNGIRKCYYSYLI